VNGCVSLDNVNISIDLSKYPVDNRQHNLINSQQACVNIRSSPINFSNQRNCTNAITQVTETSLSLIISPDDDCSSQGFNGWEASTIVISILLVLIITAIILSLTVRPIRNKIFKSKAIRDDIKSKAKFLNDIEEEEVKSKLSKLQDDIKSLNDDHDRVKSMLEDNE